MITINDIKRSILINSAAEWADQCKLLGTIAKNSSSMEAYRSLLSLLRQAEEELPADVEWIKGRIEMAKDSVVEGWVYR